MTNYNTRALIKMLKDHTLCLNVEVVRHCVASGVNINAVDEDGMTPLLLLLQRTQAINTYLGNQKLKDRYGAQAIKMMTDTENFVLAILLHAGASLDVQTPEGATPLDLTAERMDNGLSRQLLQREAYRRSQPDLMSAVSFVFPAWPLPQETTREAAAQALFELCACSSRDSFNQDVNRAIDATEDDREVMIGIRFLPSGPLLHPVDAYAGQKATYLLHLFPSLVNARDKDGYTPLQRCFVSGHTDCVAVLIVAGADFSATDARGRTLRQIVEDEHADVSSTAFMRKELLSALALFEDIDFAVRKVKAARASDALPLSPSSPSAPTP